MRLAGALVTILDPSPDEAREWLATELAKPDYQDTRSLLQRFMEWLGRRVSDLQGTQGAGGISFPPIVVTVLVILLAVGAVVLLTRVRRERRTPTGRGTVLGDTTLGATQLRAAGAEAVSRGDYDTAVLCYVRAMARDGERRTLVTNAASLTAREVGEELSRAFPLLDSRIRASMVLFDEVAYGDYPASRRDAETVRDADDAVRTAHHPARAVTAVPPLLVAPGAPLGHDPHPVAPVAPPDGGSDSVWLRGGGR